MDKLRCAFLVALLAHPITQGADMVHDLECTKENPRNSEGAFVTLKSGRVLFLYTQFLGGGSDESPARIAEIHSDDGGKSWSKPTTAVENAGGRNVMSVSLLRLKSGKLAMFYLVKNSWIDCRPVIRYSEDEGATWSEPRRVVDAPGYFVLNNDRVIQTSNGRLVMPLAFHRSRGEDPKSSKSFDSRAITMWYLSDDEGKTWREADQWWASPLPSRTGLQEPGVAELADKTLLSWARTDLESQFAMRSRDGGKTWSAPVASELKSPASPASIKRLPGSDDLLAIFNDHSGQVQFAKGKRTPLVAAISSDGGNTWGKRREIETDPAGFYCYTAMHFTEDAVLLSYSASVRKDGKMPFWGSRIRRIPLTDVRAK